jgi:hypothetical protein
MKGYQYFFFIFISTLFCIVLIFIIEERNYSGIKHYGGLHIIPFTIKYVLTYFTIFLFYIYKFPHKSFTKSIQAVVLVFCFLLFPTIRSEKYSYVINKGEYQEQHLPIDCGDEFCNDSDNYIRIGTFIFSVKDLFTMKRCGYVYEDGHKKDFNYCKRYFTIGNFTHLGESISFLIHLYSILLTTLLFILIFKHLLKTK